jgi:pimeloyl-ACP methyl ester carboxylesterase
MAQVQAGDVKLYYEVHGGGEPLLMIMGLGSSSATWSPVLVTELSRRFQTRVTVKCCGSAGHDQAASLG